MSDCCCCNGYSCLPRLQEPFASKLNPSKSLDCRFFSARSFKSLSKSRLPAYTEPYRPRMNAQRSSNLMTICKSQQIPSLHFLDYPTNYCSCTGVTHYCMAQALRSFKYRLLMHWLLFVKDPRGYSSLLLVLSMRRSRSRMRRSRPHDFKQTVIIIIVLSRKANKLSTMLTGKVRVPVCLCQFLPSPSLYRGLSPLM